MLYVKEPLEVDEVLITSDPYIPLEFRCADVADAVPFYWRTGDLKRQLIEIGLNQSSGAICRTVIVNLGPFQTSNEEMPTITSNIEFGLPVCDISAWPVPYSDHFIEDPDRFINDRFIDEIMPYEVTIYSNGVAITFFNGEYTVDTLYQCGDLSFGICQNALCGLYFMNIDNASIKEIIKNNSPRE